MGDPTPSAQATEPSVVPTPVSPVNRLLQEQQQFQHHPGQEGQAERKPDYCTQLL